MVYRTIDPLLSGCPNKDPKSVPSSHHIVDLLRAYQPNSSLVGLDGLACRIEPTVDDHCVYKNCNTEPGPAEDFS